MLSCKFYFDARVPPYELTDTPQHYSPESESHLAALFQFLINKIYKKNEKK